MVSFHLLAFFVAVSAMAVSAELIPDAGHGLRKVLKNPASLLHRSVVPDIGSVGDDVPDLGNVLQERKSIIPTYEYSLHSSKTKKHLWSCHYTTLDGNGDYMKMPEAAEYSCNSKTRQCRSNGTGSVQAFVMNCLSSGSLLSKPGVPLPDSLN